jgi:hypothetical protein
MNEINNILAKKMCRLYQILFLLIFKRHEPNMNQNSQQVKLEPNFIATIILYKNDKMSRFFYCIDLRGHQKFILCHSFFLAKMDITLYVKQLIINNVTNPRHFFFHIKIDRFFINQNTLYIFH